MSQSLSQLYIHAIFGTKGRQPWINDDIAPHLHSYLASVLKELDSPALIINSMPDHVHVLFRISKTVTISEVMEQMKKSSSKWVKRQKSGVPFFYWQKGYGAFSVGKSQVDIVTTTCLLQAYSLRGWAGAVYPRALPGAALGQAFSLFDFRDL